MQKTPGEEEEHGMLGRSTRAAAVQFYDHYRTATIYRRRLAEHSTDPILTRTLDVLYTQKRCTLKQLCRIQGITSSTGSIMVEKYVRAGYIDRQRGETDRRKITLVLTTAGKKYIEEELERQYAALEESFRRFSPEQLAAFIDAIGAADELLKKLELEPEE